MLSEAAEHLGISIKVLRVYERRGLLAPSRTAVGYRVYGPDEMARAERMVAFDLPWPRAVATRLGSPEVRARTADVIAWRRQVS